MSANATLDIEIGVDGYCTLANVLALIPARTINATNTRPVKADAIRLIRDTFSEVNAVLDGSLGYQVPVASGNGTAMQILRKFNSLGAGAQIELAAGSGNAEPSAVAQYLQVQYEAMKASFAKGEMSIPGVEQQGNYIEPMTERKPAAVFDQVGGNEQDSVFTKGMDF